MRLKIEEVNIERITRREAMELRNEILKVTKQELHFKPKEYPCLYRLYTLLTNSFENSTNGIHFIGDPPE